MGAERTFIAVTGSARPAEQDAHDLHRALATAIARIEAANDLMQGTPWQIEYADLYRVLQRTARWEAEPPARPEPPPERRLPPGHGWAQP